MNEYERRSIELAVKNGMTWASARFFVGTQDGRELYTVQSKSDSTKQYRVESRADHVLACACPAGAWGKPCCHAGAVQMRLEWRKALIAAESEDEMGPAA